MINWIKLNFLSIIIIGILVYVLIELERVKDIAIKTEAETEMNTFKLDIVDGDINRSQLDTLTCCDNKNK